MERRAHQLHAALTDVAEPTASRDGSSGVLPWNLSEPRRRAELLLRVTIHILEHGVTGGEFGREYVANKVGNALAPYVLTVILRDACSEEGDGPCDNDQAGGPSHGTRTHCD